MEKQTATMPEARRSAIAGVAVMVAVLLLVLVGGWLVRTAVSAAFRAGDEVRDARDLTDQLLRAQLDEETAVRGYAAARDRVFLQPLFDGRAAFRPALVRLDRELASLALDPARADLADAGRLNARWYDGVAQPLLGGAHNTLALQLRGKDLVDAIRADLQRVDAALVQRERTVDAQADAAIRRIGVFVAAVLLALVAVGALYLRGQLRLATKLAEQQRAAADEHRRAAAAEAAYLAEKRIADALQEALVQRPLPLLPSMHFSATYVPASEEARVGGDWYDALELSNQRVLFAIGDVTGHGLPAAVAMNRAREALLSSALIDPDPASLLQRVNAELLRTDAPLVTALAGYVDAATFEIVYSLAGHPPPILREPGKPPRFLPFGSLPLGVLADGHYRTERIQTVPGALLVLYTDGAVEHTHDLLAGERLLLDAVGSLADDHPEPAAQIHRLIFADRSAGDDVAILTICFAGHGAGMTITADQAKAGFAGRGARGSRRNTQARDTSASWPDRLR